MTTVSELSMMIATAETQPAMSNCETCWPILGGGVLLVLRVALRCLVVVSSTNRVGDIEAYMLRPVAMAIDCMGASLIAIDCEDEGRIMSLIVMVDVGG